MDMNDVFFFEIFLTEFSSILVIIFAILTLFNCTDKTCILVCDARGTRDKVRVLVPDDYDQGIIRQHFMNRLGQTFIQLLRNTF
jgi:hypothetical protein